MRIFINQKPLLISKEYPNLLKLLNDCSETIYQPCGGRKSCGKCKVKINASSGIITEEERKLLTEQELSDNVRLACFVKPESDMQVEVGEFSNYKIENFYSYDSDYDKELTEGYGLVIDIGTTTIVAELIDLSTDENVKHFALLNRQKSYGSDVISRINHCLENDPDELCAAVRESLLAAINEILAKTKIPANQITRMVFSGNTTMISSLLNADLSSMGAHPYTVPIERMQTKTFSEVFDSDLLDTSIQILPHISAFVGGDVVAGLWATGFFVNKNTGMFLDMGTNGEIAIGNADKILASGTAAGPAFEGGQLSCGMGSYDGAIYDVDAEFNYLTIGNTPAKGICGTGIISLLARLLENEILEDGGRIKDGDKFSLTDNISLSQDDVRQIQYAKSAIRSSIDGLIRNFGCRVEDIESFYIGGGFSRYISLPDLTRIGIIPEELEDKAVIVGNSSLWGARKVLLQPKAYPDVVRRVESINHIDMASDPDYFDDYVDNLSF